MNALTRLAGAMALATLIGSSAVAAPLGTGFTYQGQLIQSGTPVTGLTTLRFSLWDAAGSGSPPTGGTQVGASQILANVAVTNGIFTVQLNGGGEFGAAAFDGNARWLQIEVCTDPVCTTVTTLSPRQAITAAPYSRFSAAPWQKSGGNVSFSGGNVGIGTTSPAFALDVQNNAASDVLRLQNSSPIGWSSISTYDNNGLGKFGIGYGNASSSLPVLAGRGFCFTRPGVDFVIAHGAGTTYFTAPGDVGIGTATPAAKLDVRGDVKLGASGQYFAPGGEENLRMMRGYVSSNGTSLTGCCYSVARVATGTYRITFTGPFVGTPTVVITADNPSQNAYAFTYQLTGTSVLIAMINSADNTAVDAAFNFIAMGSR